MSKVTANPAGRITDPRGRPGVTLVEVLLSVGITAILLAATVSMMFVARQAIASGADSGAKLAQESTVVQMLTTDLGLATSFAERTDKAVTMTVPDRTGDGQPETIRYAWSGVAGDPLTRQVNGGTVVPLAAGIQFKLTYLTKSLTP